MENNQYTGDVRLRYRNGLWAVYCMTTTKPFITYQLQMLKNNTPHSINLRNELRILQLKLQDAKAGTAQAFILKTKIRNTEKVLLAYKSPEFEYEIYV